MKDLTARQIETYQFILDFVKEHSYPPTIREIAGHFEISVKAAHDHIVALKKKNKIKTNGSRQRTMEIIADKEDVVYEGCADIPILSDIASNWEIFAEENYSGSIKIDSTLLKKNKQYFALKVSGDSMTGIGVMDGDTAIIEQTENAANGDIVAVETDDGRILTRFFKQANRVKLQSENPAYPPLYSTNVRILGQLAGVCRSY
ncbi:MAG: transcriptional repressor LexA [Spirochaetaceae bacterium]|jgi:repressor LexA|nr:transcriptional repressor LexA [Spirochaetaceae bacterium]